MKPWLSTLALLTCLISLPAWAKHTPAAVDAAVDKMICQGAQNLDRELGQLIGFVEKAESDPSYGPTQLDWLSGRVSYLKQSAQWNTAMDQFLLAPRGVNYAKTIGYNLGEALASPVLAIFYAILDEGDRISFKVYHTHKRLTPTQAAQADKPYDPKPSALVMLSQSISLYRAMLGGEKACREELARQGANYKEEDIPSICEGKNWALNEVRRLSKDILLPEILPTLKACSGKTGPAGIASDAGASPKTVAVQASGKPAVEGARSTHVPAK